MSTAAALVVGDEILQGHTLDTNSHRLASRLRSRGVELRRRVTVPDEGDEIAGQLKALLAAGFEFVFVIGGIGPTPDDRTYEAVAQAVGRPLVLRPEDRAWIEERVVARGYGKGLLEDPAQAEGLLRMVRRPDGSERLENPVGAALGSAIRAGATTVFVLPGVPREFDAMLADVIEPRYLPTASSGPVVAELEVVGEEARLWSTMRALEEEFPRLKIGSYPQDERGRIVLRAQGEAAQVEAALRRLDAAMGGRGRRIR